MAGTPFSLPSRIYLGWLWEQVTGIYEGLEFLRHPGVLSLRDRESEEDRVTEDDLKTFGRTSEKEFVLMTHLNQVSVTFKNTELNTFCIMLLSSVLQGPSPEAPL